MYADEVTIEVRDKNLRRVGQIEPQFFDFALSSVHLGLGEWTIRLPREHEQADNLRTPGYGIIVRFRDNEFMSGPMNSPASVGSPEDPEGLVTIQGYDDNIIAFSHFASPDPTSQDQVTFVKSHDSRVGNAEALMHGYVNQNVGPGALAMRKEALERKIIMGPNLNRGPVLTMSPRWQPLGELLAEIGSAAGLGYQFIQRGGNIVFETYEIRDRRKFVRFDIENGTLAEESVVRSAPTATVAYVLGQGEGVDRQVIRRTTPQSLAAQVEWGIVKETVTDQRNTDVVEELQQSGDQILAEAGFTSTSVKAIPSDDVDGMLYEKDWRKGDSVTAIVEGQESSSTVTQVVMVVNSTGATLGAAIGDVTGFDPDAALKARVDNTESRVAHLERNAEQRTEFSADAVTSGQFDRARMPALPHLELRATIQQASTGSTVGFHPLVCWNTVEYNEGVWPVSGNSILTIPEDGLYDIDATVTMNGAEFVIAVVGIDDNNRVRLQGVRGTAVSFSNNVSGKRWFPKGYRLRIHVYTSVSMTNLIDGANTPTVWSITKIGN